MMNHREMRKHSLEYELWAGMVRRCTSPSNGGYANYGGRGIRVCDRWRTFKNFLADMGPRPSRKHSIDRIDGNGHYEPGNCRWATWAEQRRNVRTNHLLTFEGVTLPLCDWATRTGMLANTILQRLRGGWSVERALTEPARPWNRPRRAA